MEKWMEKEIKHWQKVGSQREQRGNSTVALPLLSRHVHTDCGHVSTNHNVFWLFGGKHSSLVSSGVFILGFFQPSSEQLVSKFCAHVNNVNWFTVTYNWLFFVHFLGHFKCTEVVFLKGLHVETSFVPCTLSVFSRLYHITGVYSHLLCAPKNLKISNDFY